MVMSGHCSSWSAGLCPKAMRSSYSFFRFRRGGTLGRSCPGRSGSCDGAAGSLPALQRADGFSPSGSEGTVHTDCLARWIGSANMRLSPRRGEPPYQQDIACPAYTVNYLFRLLRVRIKRDRAHGQRWKDLPSGLPYGRECPCSHRYSVEGHMDSSARIPCRTEPGATSPG